VTGLDLLVGLWLAIAVTSLFKAMHLLSRAREARHWLYTQRLNGVRLIVADGVVRRGYARLVVQVCFIGMGVIVVLNSHVVPLTSEYRAMLSAIFRMLFIFSALTLLWSYHVEQMELVRILNESLKARARAEDPTLWTRKEDGNGS
jgi:hypothetical protein